MQSLCVAMAFAMHLLCVSSCYATQSGVNEPLASCSFQYAPSANPDKHIYVDVLVNGKGPFRFVLDSGASESFVTPKVAAQAKIIDLGPSNAFHGGFGKSFKVENGEISTLTVAGIPFRAQPCGISTFNHAVDCDGVLSTLVFQQYALNLNFSTKTLSLYDAYTYIMPGHSAAVSVTFDKDQLPVCSATIDGVACKLSLDTGQSDGLVLLPGTAAWNALSSKCSQIGSVTLHNADGIHSAGTYKVDRIEVKSDPPGLTWTDTATGGITTAFEKNSPTMAAKFDYDGRIGMELLSKGNLTFDYIHSRIVLSTD